MNHCVCFLFAMLIGSVQCLQIATTKHCVSFPNVKILQLDDGMMVSYKQRQCEGDFIAHVMCSKTQCSHSKKLGNPGNTPHITHHDVNEANGSFIAAVVDFQLKVDSVSLKLTDKWITEEFNEVMGEISVSYNSLSNTSIFIWETGYNNLSTRVFQDNSKLIFADNLLIRPRHPQIISYQNYFLSFSMKYKRILVAIIDAVTGLTLTPYTVIFRSKSTIRDYGITMFNGVVFPFTFYFYATSKPISGRKREL